MFLFRSEGLLSLGAERKATGFPKQHMVVLSAALLCCFHFPLLVEQVFQGGRELMEEYPYDTGYVMHVDICRPYFLCWKLLEQKRNDSLDLILKIMMMMLNSLLEPTGTKKK